MLLDSLGNTPGSYVITDKSTGLGVYEFYDTRLIPHINIKKYDVLPIYDYLARLNKAIALME